MPQNATQNCSKGDILDGENYPICEIKFRNTLTINDLRNPFQYSHICKRLSIW